MHEIEGLVDSLLASWQRSGSLIHGRRWHRIPYSKTISVTALDERSEEPVSEPIVATGQDVSLGGIAFAHSQAVPQRLVAVTFDLLDGSSESIVTALKWCRFGRDGRYRSGGRFLRAFTH
ncbi:MAG: hypothetical protein CMJ48_03400 [Planctomycetaceae bacterium]|nr:hypothetical protein [Planctomycetaceae bacterium]